MSRLLLEPNTTLFPVPVVLITCGNNPPNVFTLNRISSCNAEPPMLAVSVRPARYSHDLIQEHQEFVVNIPDVGMELQTDYVGVTTGRDEDKWQTAGLTPLPANSVSAPIIGECVVNLECKVVQTVHLPSHALFIAEVVYLHAKEEVLNERQEIDMALIRPLAYGVSVVRERPVRNVNVSTLREELKQRH